MLGWQVDGVLGQGEMRRNAGGLFKLIDEAFKRLGERQVILQRGAKGGNLSPAVLHAVAIATR